MGVLEEEEGGPVCPWLFSMTAGAMLQMNRCGERVLISDAIRPARIISLLSAIKQNPNRLIDKYRRLEGSGLRGRVSVSVAWLLCEHVVAAGLSGTHKSSASQCG